MYEVYLFYEKKYISKYLFLEKDTYKIRENEKRNYNTTKNYIELKPFKINKKILMLLIQNSKKLSEIVKLSQHMIKLWNLYKNLEIRNKLM